MGGFMTLEKMMNLFSPAVRKLPRFSSLAEAVLRQVVDLQAVIPAMEAAFSLDEAVGVQLDLLGDTLRLERGSLSDEGYRELIRSKLALWRWNGMNESVPETLAECFPDGRVSISDNMNGSVNVGVTGTTPSNLDEKIPVPAGVERIVTAD